VFFGRQEMGFFGSVAFISRGFIRIIHSIFIEANFIIIFIFGNEFDWFVYVNKMK
jgi:hypothetical protein